MQSWTWESLSITKNANPCRWRWRRCSRKVSFIRIIFHISWNSIIYCPGPKGPDGKGLRKLIEYCSSKDPHYVVEIRPNKRSQGKELGGLFVRYITATADMWAMMLFINMSHIVEHLVFLHFQLFALCSSTKIFIMEFIWIFANQTIHWWYYIMMNDEYYDLSGKVFFPISHAHSARESYNLIVFSNIAYMSAHLWVRWHAIPFCWCNVSAISAVSAHVIHVLKHFMLL